MTGVLYEIDEQEKLHLDQIEERGYGYEEKTVNVQTTKRRHHKAVTYFALDIDTTLKPYHWYKQHVVIGAREHHFPTGYIRAIEQVESIVDPLPERHMRELQIYR